MMAVLNVLWEDDDIGLVYTLCDYNYLFILLLVMNLLNYNI